MVLLLRLIPKRLVFLRKVCLDLGASGKPGLVSPVAFGNQDADLEESRVAVNTNAISVERKARLSLPIEDGGGQQLSCRCWRCDTAHWTQPRRKTLLVAS